MIGQNQNKCPRLHKFSQSQAEVWDYMYFLKIFSADNLTDNLDLIAPIIFVVQVTSLNYKWGLRV